MQYQRSCLFGAVIVATLAQPITANAQCVRCMYYGYRAIPYVWRAAPSIERYAQCPGCTGQVIQYYGSRAAQGISNMGGPFQYETTPMYMQQPRIQYNASPNGYPQYGSGPSQVYGNPPRW